MWYAEKVWPTLVALGTVAIFAGIRWSERRQTRYLVVAALCVPLAFAAFVIERRIVTPREVVTARISDFVQAFERKDKPAVRDFISTRAVDLQRMAENALDKVTISHERVTDVNVEMSGDETPRARAHFRVNAEAMLNGLSPPSHQATRWIATWELEGDTWRMLDIEQLDPITGETIREAQQYVGRRAIEGYDGGAVGLAASRSA